MQVTSNVVPDLILALAFLRRCRAQGSLAPSQARGDEAGEGGS